MLFHHLLLSSLMLAPTASFIYPQPSQQLDGDWEPVDQYRQHHNITYNYEPVNIDPELCRHITEDVCRADDEAAARVTTQRREERRLNPRTGSYTFLVLLVQFADHTDRVLPSKEYYEELCNGTGPSGVNPVGSISDFFAENSYGNFNVECQVLDWQVSPTTEAAFAAGKSGLLGAERSQDFFRPILDDFEAASDQFAFFELDRLMGGPGGDGNQQIELVVLHSGYAAEGVGTDCTGASRDDRIQSVGYKGTDSGGWTTSDGNFEVNGYTIASALDPSNPECVDASPAKMGIVTHEMFHTFGTYDLYDPTRFEIGGMGAFDIMSSPYGQSGNPAVPGSASAFTKIRATWLEPVEITQDGLYDIQAAVNSDLVYIIREGYAEGEYLLIENRQKAGFDRDLWGSGGLAIYHVDESAGLQDSRGFPGQEGWPQNGNHYRVAVLQADGNYDLENFRNEGDEGDFFVEGRSLGPGNGSVYPNTDSYKGGNIRSTGITITDISPSGATMSFRVAGLSPAVSNPDTPQPSPRPSPGPSLRPSPRPTPKPSPRPSRRPSPKPSSRPSPKPSPAPTAPPVPPVPTPSSAPVCRFGNCGGGRTDAPTTPSPVCSFGDCVGSRLTDAPACGFGDCGGGSLTDSPAAAPAGTARPTTVQTETEDDGSKSLSSNAVSHQISVPLGAALFAGILMILI